MAIWYFSYFVIMGVAFNLNKLESPLHKGAMCQVWFKLAQWFWRRGFFAISLSSPVGKEHGPSFEQILILFNKRMLVEIGLDENVEFTDRQSKKFTLKRESDTAIFKTAHGLHGELSISIELSDGRLTDSKP